MALKFYSVLRLSMLMLILLTVGCSPQRDLVYMSNLTPEDLNQHVKIENISIPTIQPDDLLSITVKSLSVESNRLFNQGVLGTLGSSISNDNQIRNNKIDGYLVDKEGYINFPVLGKLKLGGLTKEAATDTLEYILNEKYIKNPTVNIRFLNFKITLLGEVKNPSTVTIPTEKINIFEALSLAGGLTVAGKRENVLIIREKDGHRNLIRLNLNDKNIVSSPNYYLQQNDIVYVEPDSYKAVTASLRRANIQFGLSIILSTLTIATFIITLSR